MKTTLPPATRTLFASFIKLLLVVAALAVSKPATAAEESCASCDRKVTFSGPFVHRRAPSRGAIDGAPAQLFFLLIAPTVTLHLAGQTVREFPLTLKQRILGRLMDPNVSFVLLAIGLLALYAEFNHPGAVIPGVVGLIFILLAVFALNLLPTRFAALALILVAFVLFALEAKFATHGILTVGGIALMVIGALLLVDSPVPEMRVHLLTALSVSIPIGVITAFLLTLALRARRRKVVTGVQGLIGETGLVRTPLAPQGRIFVHGELWNAVSPLPLMPGDAVVVRAVEGLTLQVDPLPAAHRTAPQESPRRS